MANIYLLRHGQVCGPAALYGHTDVAVEPQVNAQIVALLNDLSLNIGQVFTSPLQRCASLAQQINDQDQRRLTSVDGLKEMNFGVYDGVPFDQLHLETKKWQLLTKFWQNPVQHPLPQAELLTGFSYRVIQAWQQIVICLAAQPAEQNFLVVTHGGVIRMILAHLLDLDYRNPAWYTQLSIANASLTTIEYRQGKCRVKSVAKALSSEAFIDDSHDEYTLADICSKINKVGLS